MADPISTGASAVTVIDRVTAVARWVWQRVSRRNGHQEQKSHAGLEIRPMHYRMDLTAIVPRVEITLWAINYLSHPLSLREVKISRFTIGGPALDGIPLAHEITLNPQTSRLVHCERALTDSEARAVQTAATPHSCLPGGVNLLARGVSRGKEVTFQATAQVVEGTINLPRGGAAPTSA